MDIISTRAVAEVLGVSEATVKRWSDAGTLRCFRTPGGHRKFRLRDVKSFLADQQGQGDPQNLPAPPVGDLTAEQRDARSLALAGDVDALVSLVASHKLQGASLAQTFDEVFFPAMADIGEAWTQGRLSAAQEHMASVAISDMLARVRPLIERSARTDRGRALCACLGGEHHDIGIRMVSLVLASEGFRTSLLGANVPAGDLAIMLAGETAVGAFAIRAVETLDARARWLDGEAWARLEAAATGGRHRPQFVALAAGTDARATRVLRLRIMCASSSATRAQRTAYSGADAPQPPRPIVAAGGPRGGIRRT
jgi:excisionase family DNA binding protein